MRIAVITNATSAAQGGAGHIAAQYNELLRQRGHEIRVWGPREEFGQLPLMNIMQNVWFHFRDLFPLHKTVDEIRAWRPDVVLTHNLMGCGFTTPRMLRRAGMRWVHVLHDVQLVEPSGKIIEGESFVVLRELRRYILSFVRRIFFGAPNVVVSPTKWLLDFHKKYTWFHGSEKNIIPNPIRVGAQFIAPNTKGVINHAPTIIYIGRLDPDKGIDLLLEAWSARKDASAKLVIVGDGTWREKIVSMDDPSIDYKGPLPNEEVLLLLAQCSIAVVPSRVWENQPTVILEALFAGCRVVATDVGGVRETLGDAGRIVAPNSVCALVEGIERAQNAGLNTEEDRNRLEAVKRVIDAHDPETVVVALEGALMSNL